MNLRLVNFRLLQSGGNGDVYSAEMFDAGQRLAVRQSVAVKVLRESQLPHVLKGFEREVRVLTQRLPGLIPILFFNTRAQRPYYVMPLLRRGSLTRYVGMLSPLQLGAAAKELAQIIAALHGKRIIHGDIKPDNVMVADNGRLQVADPLGSGIGCTRLFSYNHGGTPGYWAPEVRAGQPISYAADIYSYAATLFHLVTGVRPRDGQALFPIFPEPDESVRTFEEIIAACSQVNPNARPTMQEVVRILNGDTWGHVQSDRNLKNFVGAACFIGVALGGLALFG
jgi:eukaryotic-like serine/threonine-protein kinase